MEAAIIEDEFWAPRASFLSPVPELAEAADLLALAADSLLARDELAARTYVAAANMPALRVYTRSIQSQTTPHIHRLRDVPGLPALRPMNARGLRQPPPAVALDIYRRDGFRCRYCGCRIVSPRAQSIMSALLPGAVTWGSSDAELNAAFYTLKGVLDHVVPHAHGSTSDPANIVVSCQPCNYGKGNYFLEQLGLSDPRLRPPVVDDWDGLVRVLPLRPARTTAIIDAHRAQPVNDEPVPMPKRLPKPKASISIDDFASSFSVTDRRYLDSLLQVIEGSSGLGVYWTLKKVLLVKRPAPAATIEAIGIESDGTVQIPWWVGPYKQAFRPFAEILAAAMPGGTTYETEKMWRVSCHGRFPRISELMHDPQALRDAFQALNRALG